MQQYGSLMALRVIMPTENSTATKIRWLLSWKSSGNNQNAEASQGRSWFEPGPNEGSNCENEKNEG